MPALAAVAYGEIGSSVYFALGIVALYALGLTPWVLLARRAPLPARRALVRGGRSPRCPETGGAARSSRRAFNDPAGFADRLGALPRLPDRDRARGALRAALHRRGARLGRAHATSPWDGVVGVGVILGSPRVRLVRRAQLYARRRSRSPRWRSSRICSSSSSARASSSRRATLADVDLGPAPSWRSLAFALALATLAYTGLETVGEPRRRGARAREGPAAQPLRRASARVVIVDARRRSPGSSRRCPAARACSAGVAAGAARRHRRRASTARSPAGPSTRCASSSASTRRVVLVAAITTSISGAGPARLLARRAAACCRARSARLNRRTLISPACDPRARRGSGLRAARRRRRARTRRRASSRASTASAILLAFTAAQLAVLRLRFTEPDLARPFRAPGNVRVRGAGVPLPALVGAAAHLRALDRRARDARRAPAIAGPLWLAARRSWSTSLVRRRERERRPRARRAGEAAISSRIPRASYQRILVPLKLGPIGEEVLATALKLAEERARAVERAARPPRAARRCRSTRRCPRRRRSAAEASIAEAQGARRGARRRDPTAESCAPASIGEAIVESARRRRRRPRPAGLGAALAPPVALLQPDRRLRPPPGALRGDGDRVPAGRARED